MCLELPQPAPQSTKEAATPAMLPEGYLPSCITHEARIAHAKERVSDAEACFRAAERELSNAKYFLQNAVYVALDKCVSAQFEKVVAANDAHIESGQPPLISAEDGEHLGWIASMIRRWEREGHWPQFDIEDEQEVMRLQERYLSGMNAKAREDGDWLDYTPVIEALQRDNARHAAKVAPAIREAE